MSSSIRLSVTFVHPTQSIEIFGNVSTPLRYFTEFGKPVLQETICGGIYANVYCIF